MQRAKLSKSCLVGKGWKILMAGDIVYDAVTHLQCFSTQQATSFQDKY